MSLPMPAESPRAQPYAQYITTDGGYLPTVETVRKLPAGAYEPQWFRPSMNTPTVVGTHSDVILVPLNLVTDELLTFDDETHRGIFTEVDQFWKSGELYAKYALLLKRAYLFYGPPGCGKSSIVEALVRQLVARDGIVFISSMPNLIGYILPKFRSVEPDRPCAIVIEDIDACMTDLTGESKLLSILDGEMRINNVLFLTTTNYPSRLDRRLLNRPGRIDRVVHVDLPSDSVRAQYLQAKIKDVAAPDGTDLVKASSGLSLGHLREMVVEIFVLGKDPKQTIERIRSMRSLPKDDQGEGSVGFGHPVASRGAS